MRPMTDKQQGVARNVAIAVMIVVLACTAALLLVPADLGESLGRRMSLAAACAVLPGLMLAVSIGRLASHRFFTPEDIDGSGLTAGTPRARMLQALLQNTLEQSVLAVVAYPAWALLAPSTWLSLLPAAAGLFVIGRVLFFRGYENGAPGRALGFGLTFYPTALMLLALALLCLARVLR